MKELRVKQLEIMEFKLAILLEFGLWIPQTVSQNLRDLDDFIEQHHLKNSTETFELVKSEIHQIIYRPQQS